jgi:acyl dehydratase
MERQLLNRQSLNGGVVSRTAECLGAERVMAPLIVDDPRKLAEFVGEELGASQWHPVTQHQIQQFADATGDHQWIHLDVERAKRDSPFGATIAHGFLTLAMISGMMREAAEIRGARMIVNYGLNRVRFPAPVRVDSSVRARFLLLALKDIPEGVEAVFTVTVECDHAAKPCCVAEWVLRFYI